MTVAGDRAMALDVMSSSTGKTVGYLKNLRKFAAETGVSFEGMGEGIKRVKQISSDISLGKASPSAFYSSLGIDPHADYEKQLQSLSNAFKKFPDQLDRVRAGARDMGFSEEEIYIAQKVTNIYTKLNKEIGSQKAHDRMVAFHKRMTAFGERMKETLGNLAMRAEPLVNKVLDGIEKLLGSITPGQIKEWTAFFDWIVKALPPMKAMLLAFAYAISPFTVKLTAAIWVLKEIYNYTQGKNNIFSEAGIMPYIKLVEHLKELWTSILELFGIHEDNIDHNMGFQKSKKEQEELKKTQDKMNVKGTGIWNPLRAIDFFLGKDSEENIKNTAGGNIDLKKVWEHTQGPARRKYEEEQKAKAETEKGKTTAPVTNNQTFNINVNESKDPRLTAQLIQKTVGDAYWQLRGGES